jgi:mannonate dehydratase
MVAVVDAILREEQRRKQAGDLRPIPFRPDHGHQMLDDLRKKTNPGYSAIGRLKGMAEVRGVELALKMKYRNCCNRGNGDKKDSQRCPFCRSATED